MNFAPFSNIKRRFILKFYYTESTIILDYLLQLRPDLLAFHIYNQMACGHIYAHKGARKKGTLTRADVQIEDDGRVGKSSAR